MGGRRWEVGVSFWGGGGVRREVGRECGGGSVEKRRPCGYRADHAEIMEIMETMRRSYGDQSDYIEIMRRSCGDHAEIKWRPHGDRAEIMETTRRSRPLTPGSEHFRSCIRQRADIERLSGANVESQPGRTCMCWRLAAAYGRSTAQCR